MKRGNMALDDKGTGCHKALEGAALDKVQIKCALLSVFDKTGIEDFGKFLASHGVTLLSTGGTARKLREAGLEVKDVSAVTDFPEILNGRVKTLPPKIHGGLLAVRGNAGHEAEM